MSIVIGIENFRKTGEICIYNEKTDDFEYREKYSNLEEIIYNLKNEFNEKLKKIFLLNRDNTLVITNNDPKVCLLSTEKLRFENYLPTVPDLGTKILEFHYTLSSAIKLVLFEVTTLDGNIYKTKPIKWIEIPFHAEDFHEMLIQTVDDNLNEIHAIITYESLQKNEFMLEKIMEEIKNFCSFTVNKSEWWMAAFKVMVYGRFLLNDKRVKSLIQLEPVKFLNVLVSKQSDLKIEEHYILPRPINTYNTQTKLMGIDLGASRCVVCISRNGRTDLVKIDQEYSMPTVISFVEDNPIIGSVAMRNLRTKSKSVLFDFKYLLQIPRWQGYVEETWPFGICQTEENLTFFFIINNSDRKLKKYPSADIYQILLQKLKVAASVYQLDLNEGKFVNQAVITIPDLSKKNIIKYIRYAAELAGIQIIDIITETHADLLYILSEYKIQPGECIIIVDIGGGTGFIQKFMIDHGKKITSVDKYDLSRLCGREIDKLLMQKLRVLFEIDEHETNSNEKSKMLAEVERMKEDLSFHETRLPDLPKNITKTENLPEITRPWFEQEVLEELFISGYVKENIGDMNRPPKSSKVYLVGGTCRIPYIQNYFKSIFGEDKVVVPTDIQHITATGALIRGLQVLSGETKPVFNDLILPAEMIEPNVQIMSNAMSSRIEIKSEIVDDSIIESSGSLPENLITGLQLLQSKTE